MIRNFSGAFLGVVLWGLTAVAQSGFPNSQSASKQPAPQAAPPATVPSAPPGVPPQGGLPGQPTPPGFPADNFPGADGGGGPLPTMDLPPSPADVLGARPVDGLSARDPFRLPEELIIKLRQKNAMNTAGGIDPSIEAIRRFPLASYQLVGIIWDVKRPKAMFMDRLNGIHMVQVNDFIGNAKGVIVSIQSGAVTVLEGKIPQIIKLKK